jgi:transcriptional regulator with GAF, ATPase, and Fis domain
MHSLRITSDRADLVDEIDAAPTVLPAVLSLLEMPLTVAKRRAAADFERSYLVRVMEQARGSVSEGARRSGLDRTNFRRLLQRHGLR